MDTGCLQHESSHCDGNSKDHGADTQLGSSAWLSWLWSWRLSVVSSWLWGWSILGQDDVGASNAGGVGVVNNDRAGVANEGLVTFNDGEVGVL